MGLFTSMVLMVLRLKQQQINRLLHVLLVLILLVASEPIVCSLGTSILTLKRSCKTRSFSGNSMGFLSSPHSINCGIEAATRGDRIPHRILPYSESSSENKNNKKCQETRLGVRKFLNLRDPHDPRPELEDIRWKDCEPKVQLLALKVCMTVVFSPDGIQEPATLLQVLPSTIIQFLEFGKAIVAYDDPLHSHRFLRRSVLGVLQRVGSSGNGVSSAGDSSSNNTGNSSIAAVYVQPAADYVLGQVLDASCLVGATKVTVKGRPKKKGFEGVMQRHQFKGGPATHGSKHHRGPGSVGAGTDPGRVLPGTRMAGRDPKQSSTVRDLLLLGINIKTNALLVKGAVPGHSGRSIVRVEWNKARQHQQEINQKIAKAAADAFVQQKKARNS